MSDSEFKSFNDPALRAAVRRAWSDERAPQELRQQIVDRYPRKDFKPKFIQEYFAGFAHKPGTTYGTVNSSICERLIPGYKAPNAVDLINASPFPDSDDGE